MSARAVEVALPLPLQTSFTYALPDGMAVPERGVRVLVPFGPRRVVGIVTGAVDPDAEARELKTVLEVVDEAALVDAPLLDLAAWLADHYLAPPGECYRLAFPPAGIQASRAVARLVGTGAEGDPVADALRHRPLPVSTLARRLGGDPSARLARLRREGIVALDQQLDRRGFRHVRVAVSLEAAAEPPPLGGGADKAPPHPASEAAAEPPPLGGGASKAPPHPPRLSQPIISLRNVAAMGRRATSRMG